MSHRRYPERLTPRLLFLMLTMLVVPIFLFALDVRPAYAAACVNGSMTYGDAPGSYGEACETPQTGTVLRIGATSPITSPFAYPCATGLANCNARDNFLNPLTPIDLSKSQYVWSVPVSNTTSSTAFLAGWVDWTGTGNFTSTTPITVNVPAGSTVVTLTWNIPVTATPNITTYVRLRLTDQLTGTTTPVNAWGNGEVEDYVVRTLNNPLCQPGTSFYYIQVGSSGTAPNSTDFIAQVNASSGITQLTEILPTRAGGRSGNGLAVDPKNRILYYQDNVDTNASRGFYGYHIATGTNFTITTDASTSPLNIPIATNGWSSASGAFGNGKYYAGIDGDDSGRIYETTLDSTGTISVSARLVISPTTYNGCTSSGTATGTNVCRGYGDILTDGNRLYAALWENGGAGVPSGEGQIFDVYDINSGLRLSRQFQALTGFAFQLGRDGNGQIYAVRSSNGAIYRVTNGVIVTTTLVSTIGAPVRDAGECLPNVPTAVTLSKFDVLQVVPARVTLAWATGSEINAAGFNLYRSESADGPFVRINAQLIAASAQPLVGGTYSYEDTTAVPGKTYYYQLEDVELNGRSTRHPAVSVTVASASGLGNAGGALMGLGLGALAVAGAGFVILRKKSRPV